MPNAHIINHTHWDREWFLTSVYTSRWIPGLVDRLKELAAEDPDFHYLLDGQTLVVEDLLQLDPAYAGVVERLARGGNLLIGPYYCQPDWRLTGGEALLRNLLWGRRDMKRFQMRTHTGWLVDTFGHISQAPQIHRLFGIDSVYIWRGAPQLEPYFDWTGPDGSRLFTVNLFGGYRNLYGVTHAPEIGVKRLLAELQRLEPYYPTAEIPLFDGYDLEDNPENPARFFLVRRDELPAGVNVQEDTPAGFAARMQARTHQRPQISGELLSGKYGAVFPGTLSARTALKVAAADCERLLYQVGEPLEALARLRGRPYPAHQYENWSRLLLQNAVHDCICGVSIDLVHEKMEDIYRRVFGELQREIQDALDCILAGFAPGLYAVSTSPFAYQGWQQASDRLVRVRTDGVGVWPVDETLAVEPAREVTGEFRWANSHYEARLLSDGTLQVGDASLGVLLVYREHGDTYSQEAGELLGRLHPDGAFQVQRAGEYCCVLTFSCSGSWDGVQVTALVRVLFDDSALIRFQVELDSHGCDFRVDLVFETGLQGEIQAGMPFDIATRPPADRNLLPAELDEPLNSVLIGQRELGSVELFPFHDFVAYSTGAVTAAVLARGLHAYQADGEGRIALTLRRSVEWLAKSGLQGRVGDAGPFFYVPGAREERRVVHEAAFLRVDYGPEDPRFLAVVAAYQNPPLVVEAPGPGTRREWPVFKEDLPLSGLFCMGERTLARLYNPTSRPLPLSRTYVQTDVEGEPGEIIEQAPPKAVLTLELPLEVEQVDARSRPARWLNPPPWRVGPDHGRPDAQVLRMLQERIAALDAEIAALRGELERTQGAERYRLQHRLYILQREQLEYRLTVRLNELKLEQGGEPGQAYLYEPDEQVAALGKALNDLRIRRRIYDYIVQAI